jgi:transcriptional regulator with XRE-family HTH domain
MYAASELSHIVRARRTEMGLTQATVARLCGLSRATVNQIEAGNIRDLSLSRTANLLAVLGVSIVFSAFRHASVSGKPRMSAMQRAAQSASVSFKTSLPIDVLEEALSNATVPDRFAHHLNEVLESSSVALLADLVNEVHEARNLERKKVWDNMRQLAKELGTRREMWESTTPP